MNKKIKTTTTTNNAPLELVLRLDGPLQRPRVLHDLGHLLQQRIRLHDPDGQRHEARDVHADEVAEVGERGHARGLVDVARAGTSLAPAPALATAGSGGRAGRGVDDVEVLEA